MTLSDWMYCIGAWSLEEFDDFMEYHYYKLEYSCEDVYNRWIYGV
jgi:hypothetical protein